MNLDTPITHVPGTNRRYCPALRSVGIETVRDLIFYLPFRFEEYGTVSSLSDAVPDENMNFLARIESVKSRRSFGKRRMTITEAKLTDGTGEITAVWFNQSYLTKWLVQGRTYRFAGKIKKTKFGLRLITPIHEAASAQTDTSFVAPIMSVYPLTTGLTQHVIRKFMAACRECMDMAEDTLPEHIREKYDLMPLGEALKETHFPTDLKAAETARRRLGFDEFFRMQIAIGRTKRFRDRSRAVVVPHDKESTRLFLDSLPFELTSDQGRAVREILRDMQKGVPMHRLLDGDVGSGKTAVAMVAALNVVSAGHQAAIMAPTEILARQHFESFKKFFHEQQTTVTLWTNSYKRSVRGGKEVVASGKKEANLLRGYIAEGRIGIMIGTHALVEEGLNFSSLALAVVDEQHRFGVRTRQLLCKKSGDPNTEPHLLSMTATPIPRSLALTAFGDLDLSLLKEKPAGRKDVETRIVPPEKREETYGFIRAQVALGRQVFVVCPLIDQSDVLEVTSVTEESEKLRQGELKGIPMEVLHGRMKPAEKEGVMERFLAVETKVLVTTSVVEVGVDVPNATVMCIEGAERFGLAQLHQFRGRIGRGTHESFCFLFPTSMSAAVKERLKAVVRHKDGFALAEKDLEMRGPGEILGVAQSGFPELQAASLGDVSLIRDAREAAESILDEDPELSRYPDILGQVERRLKAAHLE